jgi:hypothetical protein
MSFFITYSEVLKADKTLRTIKKLNYNKDVAPISQSESKTREKT